MNKTKIILITLTVVLALIAIVLLIVFHNANTTATVAGNTSSNSPYHTGTSSPISDSGVTVPTGNQPNFPTTYRLSVTSTDTAYTGTITANNEQTDLTQTDIQKYGLVYFNSPHDVMFIECPQGFVSSNPTSATGNTVSIDPDIGSNIPLHAGTQNNLTIICTKR